jgi:hypothetical protein
VLFALSNESLGDPKLNEQLNELRNIRDKLDEKKAAASKKDRKKRKRSKSALKSQATLTTADD